MPIRTISSALQEKAKRELNEVPDRVQDDLKHIKDWLVKQPHLKVRPDDQWLLSFLRGCKFSLERTKEKLDLFYTMKTLAPEFFSHKDPFSPNIQEYLQKSIVLPLPKTNGSAGPRVIIVRAKKDPEKVSLITLLKMFIMDADIVTAEDDNFVIAGTHIILDLQDLSYKYMTQITPSIVKKVILCLQYAYPTRPKGFHFINMPSFFESVYNLVKIFTTEKIIKRVNFYTKDDLCALYKIIPLSILPKEYGGEGDSAEKIAAEWKLKFESYREWFLEDADYYSDEIQRPGDPKTSAELFGLEGSFRKLEVD